MFVAELFLGVTNIGAVIDQHLFHDQRRVVLGIAAAATQDMNAGFCQPGRQRHELQHRAWMHEQDDRVRRMILGDQALPFKEDGAAGSGKPVGFRIERVLIEADDDRQPFHLIFFGHR